MLIALDNNLSFTVQFSDRRRSVALHIKGGELLVKAPSGYALSAIRQLVVSRRQWIDKHLSRYPQQIKPDWLALRRVPFLGQERVLQLQRGSRSSVTALPNALLLTVSNRVSAQRHDRVSVQLLTLWYRQQARQQFAIWVERWQQQMELQAKKVYIGNWRSKWGYCKATAEVGFNWRLLMAPEWVAEYVVVHELAHLKHMNHSAQFWQLVAAYFPRYAAARTWLKENAYWMDI